MPSLESSEFRPSEGKISIDDLLDYIGGGCDPVMRDRIARQRTIIGSPVHKWLEEMDRKCRDPFNIDWNRLYSEEFVEGETPTGQADGQTETY